MAEGWAGARLRQAALTFWQPNGQSFVSNQRVANSNRVHVRRYATVKGEKALLFKVKDAGIVINPFIMRTLEDPLANGNKNA